MKVTSIYLGNIIVDQYIYSYTNHYKYSKYRCMLEDYANNVYIGKKKIHYHKYIETICVVNGMQ